MSDEVEIVKEGVEITVPVTLPAGLASLLVEHKGWELADGSKQLPELEEAAPLLARGRFAPEPDAELEAETEENRSGNDSVPSVTESEDFPNEPAVEAAPAPAKKRAAKKTPAKAAVETPEGKIKGNLQSMLYHMPGQPYYTRTKAEAWFDTEAEAQAAGYKPWTPKPKKK